MGMMEKTRYRSFLQFVQEYNVQDSKTWDGFDANTATMKACFEKFGLDSETADFTGHALALYLNDEYVATECIAISWKVHILYLFAAELSRNKRVVVTFSFSPWNYLELWSLDLFISLYLEIGDTMIDYILYDISWGSCLCFSVSKILFRF